LSFDLRNSVNAGQAAEQSSYREIFKATSLFGGVQAIQILIGIVRTKFVAVLLGTTGVGIIGLLNSPLQLILSVTGLGITFSAVRDISEAYGRGDVVRIGETVLTLKRWSWFAGVLGLITTIALAPLLSKWTFGDAEYTWAFVWLALTMLLQTISNGQRSLLQASRRLKDLARASVWGSVLGLFTSIPLFYLFGIKGIVPSLILTAVTSLLLSWVFSRKVETHKVKMSLQETGGDLLYIMLMKTAVGFFFGIVIGFVRYRTKNTYAAMLMHGVMNVFGR